jgi:hypothetical protein
MNSFKYSQLDLAMEIEESAPRPVTSSVMDTCVRFIYCNRLNYFRSYSEDRKAVCFELPIFKERIKPWVWIEDIMNKRQLRLTTYNTDVALRKDVREAVESVGELWKMENPGNKCQILFRTKYVRIRKIVPYKLLEEKPLFERRLTDGIVGIRQAMEYIFPDTAKNITLIHRVASNWPDPKRLEIL